MKYEISKAIHILGLAALGILLKDIVQKNFGMPGVWTMVIVLLIITFVLGWKENE